MTQLLISVKNSEEAKIALNAGVDIIDLKDPNNGALGALDLKLSAEIVDLTQQVNCLNFNNKTNRVRVLTSATVGEHHLNLDELMTSILERVSINVDIIKVAISTLDGIVDWQKRFDILKIIALKPNMKLVAVFFADQQVNLNLLETIHELGFYGAMLDTANKQQSLLEICSLQTLLNFTQTCEKNALKSGLAGSLKPQDVEFLSGVNPFYIGLRGGVCESGIRINALDIDKIIKTTHLLQEHNKFNDLAHQS